MKPYFSLILAIAATVSAQIVPSTGNVRGPTSATDNAVARYDGATGKLIQNSGVTIDDSSNLTVSGGQTLTVGSSANYSLWKDGTPTKAGRVILNNAVSNGLSLGLYDGSSWVDTLHIAPANNVLIGTTADTGQKLQVSGTAAVLSSGTDQRTFLASNSAGSAEFGVFPNGKGYLATTTADNFEFYTNNTLALTLDSSQNATFAGSITTSAPTGGAGAWELGVANNVSPTAPNRTITIEIGGTVYYIHAKTTND